MDPMNPANCLGFLISEIWENKISRLERTSCGYLEPSAPMQSSNFHYYHLSTYYVLQDIVLNAYLTLTQ